MSILVELKRCRTAEEFFNLLEVPYDEEVVRVSRLHILKHFALQLGALQGRQPPWTDAELRRLVAEALRHSHDLFRRSSGVEQRLFKVFDCASGCGGSCEKECG